MQRYSTSLVIREIQIKITLGYNFTSLNSGKKKKKSGTTKCGRGFGIKGTLTQNGKNT